MNTSPPFGDHDTNILIAAVKTARSKTEEYTDELQLLAEKLSSLLVTTVVTVPDAGQRIKLQHHVYGEQVKWLKTLRDQVTRVQAVHGTLLHFKDQICRCMDAMKTTCSALVERSLSNHSASTLQMSNPLKEEEDAVDRTLRVAEAILITASKLLLTCETEWTETNLRLPPVSDATSVQIHLQTLKQVQRFPERQPSTYPKKDRPLRTVVEDNDEFVALPAFLHDGNKRIGPSIFRCSPSRGALTCGSPC